MVSHVTDSGSRPANGRKNGLFAAASPKSHMNPTKNVGDTVFIAWDVGNNSPTEPGNAQVSASVPGIFAANVDFGPIVTVGAGAPTVVVAASLVIPAINPLTGAPLAPGAYPGVAFLRGTDPGSLLTEDHSFTITIPSTLPELFVVSGPIIS